MAMFGTKRRDINYRKEFVICCILHDDRVIIIFGVNHQIIADILFRCRC